MDLQLLRQPGGFEERGERGYVLSSEMAKALRQVISNGADQAGQN